MCSKVGIFVESNVSTSKSRVKCIFGLSKSSALADFRFQKGVNCPYIWSGYNQIVNEKNLIT